MNVSILAAVVSVLAFVTVTAGIMFLSLRSLLQALSYKQARSLPSGAAMTADEVAARRAAQQKMPSLATLYIA